MLKIFGLGQFTKLDLYCKYSGITVNNKNLARAHSKLSLFSNTNKYKQSFKTHSHAVVGEVNEFFKFLNDSALGYYLKRYLKRRLLVLRKSRCWRGLRHEQHLPVRGQRSKTNANTRKKRLA